MKRRTVTILFLTMIIILIGLMALFFIQKSDDVNPEKELLGENLASNSPEENNNLENLDLDNPDISISTPEVGGAGGGGGGAGGETPSFEPTCEETEEITYAMINMNRTSTCIESLGEVCIDKIVNCKIEVYNREEVVAGTFEMELLFVEEGKSQQDFFDSKVSSFYIEPDSFQIFEGETRISSLGEDGLANQRINCFFNTLNVPLECI